MIAMFVVGIMRPIQGSVIVQEKLMVVLILMDVIFVLGVLLDLNHVLMIV